MRLLTSLLLALYSHAALCCSCVTEPMQDQFDQVAAVFQAQVISREQHVDGGDEVRLRVKKIWKTDGRSLRLVTSSSHCEFQFEAGKSYVIFALRRGESSGGSLFVFGCSHTMDISDLRAAELLDFLNGQAPKQQ